MTSTIPKSCGRSSVIEKNCSTAKFGGHAGSGAKPKCEDVATACYVEDLKKLRRVSSELPSLSSHVFLPRVPSGRGGLSIPLPGIILLKLSPHNFEAARNCTDCQWEDEEEEIEGEERQCGGWA